jgi:hypothetical protein
MREGNLLLPKRITQEDYDTIKKECIKAPKGVRKYLQKQLSEINKILLKKDVGYRSKPCKKK